MFKYGLLLLSYRPTQLTSLLSHVGSYLKAANLKISNTLYISLVSGQLPKNSVTNISALSSSDLIRVVPKIYVEAHKHAPRLDVRVLHHDWYHARSTNVSKRKLYYFPEVVLTNETTSSEYITQYLDSHFDITNQLSVIRLAEENSEHFKTDQSSLNATNDSDKVYEHVCLGGTFDNLHNGHKVLLSTAQLKCRQSLTIGVTDLSMVKHKTLWELIETPEKRIEHLRRYLEDVDPYIEYKITPISDPFGPAIVDESLQAIVVSEETVRGGQKINEIRRQRGMSQLEIEVIKLVGEGHKESEAEEDKVSSSSLRIRKLGTLIKPPEKRLNLPNKPYLIGLTGMIASGKSSISEKLRKLGAAIINVDLLAHQTYRSPTAPAFKEIVQHFGTDILDADGNINRRKLGQIVFDDKDKLAQLNDIIWPKVSQLVEEEVNQLKEKYSVIVLEIALLIEANWMHKVHQVWLTVLDEPEAVRRLITRNQLSEQEATKRVQALMPSQQKIPHANVVFCTFWPEQVTWEQVHRAWKMLNDFVEP